MQVLFQVYALKYLLQNLCSNSLPAKSDDLLNKIQKIKYPACAGRQITSKKSKEDR